MEWLRRRLGRLGRFGRTGWGGGDRAAARIHPAQFTPWPAGGVLVGGAVRDALLGRPARDLDWLVADPEGAAREAAAELGGSVFALDAERGHWRVVAPAPDAPPQPLPDTEVGEAFGEGSDRHAVQRDYIRPLGAPPDARTPPDGTPLAGARLERDLLARDFTVNALALQPDGRLVDPAGGLRDLRARRLRMVARANLASDPVRLLRAARLAAALNFAVEPATARAVAELAAAQRRGEWPAPAPERVREELDALLLSERAGPGMLQLDALGLLEAYLPELAEGRGLEQGGFHHLDVLHHNLEALNQLVQGFPEADLALRWATLLHDVAKPRTRAPGADGRVHFYGHAREGAAMAQALLRRLRAPEARARRAAALVKHHMDALPRGERAARRFAHRRREILPDLLKLMIADREAARGPRSSEASRRAYRLALARVLAILAEAPPRPPLLDGRRVMTLLQLEPGPEVGAALRFLREAEAVGDVRDAAQAEAALRRFARAQGWLDDEREGPSG